MSSPEPEIWRIALIGGTGPEGRGLAQRLALAGHTVVIGSRSAERAREVAAHLRNEAGDIADITGASNAEVVPGADLTMLTIPYSGLHDTLPPLERDLRNKIVISTIAPIEFRDGRPVALQVEAGSAAQEVARMLPEARVVSAFQTVDAHALSDLQQELDTDVLVSSDDTEARRLVVRLANGIAGVRALSAGRLASSRYVEECTALLITLNRIYKSHSGIRITGVDR
jgi:8-hydroxy-5-deazaflavin:NADPH oxidoreductase